jgi:hypothetical protein
MIMASEHRVGRTTVDVIIDVSYVSQNFAYNCDTILSYGNGDMLYLIDRVAGFVGHGAGGRRTQELSIPDLGRRSLILP